MAKRVALQLTSQQKEELTRISQSRTASVATVRRAKILLKFAQGQRINRITQEMASTRPLVEHCIDKALAFRPPPSLQDLPSSGHPTIITEGARAWILSLACQKPTDLGYASETWTYSLLLKHIQDHYAHLGHVSLAKPGKGRLHTILNKSNIRPHKISYYVERKTRSLTRKWAPCSLCTKKSN